VVKKFAECGEKKIKKQAGPSCFLLSPLFSHHHTLSHTHTYTYTHTSTQGRASERERDNPFRACCAGGEQREAAAPHHPTTDGNRHTHTHHTHTPSRACVQRPPKIHTHTHIHTHTQDTKDGIKTRPLPPRSGAPHDDQGGKCERECACP
jgi:hypothetical protein